MAVSFCGFLSHMLKMFHLEVFVSTFVAFSGGMLSLELNNRLSDGSCPPASTFPWCCFREEVQGISH